MEIQLPNVDEARLRLAAEQEGMTPEELVVRWVRDELYVHEHLGARLPRLPALYDRARG